MGNVQEVEAGGRPWVCCLLPSALLLLYWGTDCPLVPGQMKEV